jgi:N-acetylmuramoyl-L-alanine amidase
MSNSSLITGTVLSPNCNKPRNCAIDKITIHHFATVANVGGARSVANAFSNPARQASANYIVDDNDIILGVDEANRSWCTSSPANDNRAITIETANDGGAPEWHVSDKTMANLINLVADICRRNGIGRLNFTGNADGNLTLHKHFANTNCPGPYLEGKMGWIVEQVNGLLGGTAPPPPTPPTPPTNDPFPGVSDAELARRTILGEFGNGQERKDRLGARYRAVQDIVNGKVTPPSGGGKSNEQLAREVIRGDWGNGEERRRRLTAAGYDYTAVQRVVNGML